MKSLKKGIHKNMLLENYSAYYAFDALPLHDQTLKLFLLNKLL